MGAEQRLVRPVGPVLGEVQPCVVDGGRLGDLLWWAPRPKASAKPKGGDPGQKGKVVCQPLLAESGVVERRKGREEELSLLLRTSSCFNGRAAPSCCNRPPLVRRQHISISI